MSGEMANASATGTGGGGNADRSMIAVLYAAVWLGAGLDTRFGVWKTSSAAGPTDAWQPISP